MKTVTIIGPTRRASTRIQLFQAEKKFPITALAIGCIFFLACFVMGCMGPSGLSDVQVRTTAEDHTLISDLQAQQIAEEWVGRTGAHGFELSRPALRKARYWRVITETAASGRNVRFTNHISAGLSRQEAKALVKEATKASFEETKFQIRLVEAVEADYWTIVVWQVPHVPGSERILFISASDGVIIDPLRIEPAPK